MDKLNHRGNCDNVDALSIQMDLDESADIEAMAKVVEISFKNGFSAEIHAPAVRQRKKNIMRRSIGFAESASQSAD